MFLFTKLINLGIDDSIPPEEANRVRALNLYILLGAQFFVLPIGLITLNWFPIQGISMLAGYPFYTLAYLFTHLGKFSIARSLVLYTNLIHCWILVFVLTASSMMHLWFLVFAALAFLLFPRSSKLNLYLVVVIGVLSFNFWCFWDPRIEGLKIVLNPNEVIWLRIAFAPAASIILPLLLAFFHEGQFRAEQKIRSLKEQQEGDYFLTNLIMQPLFKNFNQSDGIKSEFLIHQKKKFHFRNREGDLGGDLCITGNLLFYKHKYTFFVSADAMGKSMQGAGGAIVFGTVMNNILSRSTSNYRNLKIDPSVWLEETFHELHAAFVTFDGSMMNSCTMGLIEDSSGKMLYFNSEHPAIVLLRDEVAEFLDHSMLQKLGSPFMNTFKLSKFQLLPGDVLIIGSDGRDDIVFKTTGKMNEDDTLFLKFVEAAKGSLDEIFELITNQALITDDFSLIRIDYLNSESLNTQSIPPKEKEIRILLKQRQFKKVIHILDAWSIEELTDNIKMLKCFAMDRVGLGMEAKGILRKLLEQNPKHLDSILLLAYISRRSGDDDEMNQLINLAKEIDPHNSRLQDMINLSKKKV